MHARRRLVLAVLANGLTAGCLSGGGRDGATSTPDGGTPASTPGGCDPADVSRPPIVEDANHPPKGYGTKPQELTRQSVADYLADFETAYAWNRILAEHGPVTRLGVDTTTPWTPEPADGGFLAASRIETDYTAAGSETPTERAYVASYYVSPHPVYRVETDSESVDPRSHPGRELVQCGTDTKT